MLSIIYYHVRFRTIFHPGKLISELALRNNGGDIVLSRLLLFWWGFFNTFSNKTEIKRKRHRYNISRDSNHING